MQRAPRGERKRLADFARLVVAAETALGFEPGEFLQAYNETAKGGAMTALMANRQKREGTATELGSVPESLRRFDDLPDSANVRQPVVEGLFSCSSATLWRRVRDGRLPKPRKLSGRGNTWNVGQLRTILPERTAGGGSHGS